MAYTPSHCPNSVCLFHKKSGGNFIKKSFFKIRRTNQKVRRYQCKHCLKSFSSRTFKSDYNHKKMDLNALLAKLLTEGQSIRAAARTIGMTYKNTYQKFLWLTRQAQAQLKVQTYGCKVLQFDEMETIEHSKCKPLSVAIFVNENYQILSLKVARMPAKGKLSEISKKKYGFRVDEREEVLEKSFKELHESIKIFPMKIMSDGKSSYRKFVKKYFSRSKFEVHSRVDKDRHRDRLHERLHKKVYDPMFALNQRCALLRSHVKRLTRRSWCTTKKKENLQGHLDLFVAQQFGLILK
jgi:transposase-like protein